MATATTAAPPKAPAPPKSPSKPKKFRRTNETPGTRAHLGNLRTSPYKVREVLNLIRGKDVRLAQDILKFCERGPAEPVGKLLKSAVANAVENDELDADELFVSSCYADEGPTMKRFRPRAKGRASRIRKRSSSITIIVSRLPEEKLERLRAESAQQEGGRRNRVSASRAARVAGTKKKEATATAEEPDVEETETDTSAGTPVEAAAEEETSAPVTDEADATETEKEGK